MTPLSLRTIITLVALAASALSAHAADAEKLTVEELQGTWLFDAAARGKGNDELAAMWNSTVVIENRDVRIEKFLDLRAPLKGKLELHPGGKVGRIDLTLDEYDLKELGPMKLPAGTLAGVYRRSGAMLEVAFHSEPGGARPKSVDDPDPKLLTMRLVKAPKDFAGVPKSVVLKVTRPGGKPAKDVGVSSFISMVRGGKPAEGERKWALHRPATTDEQGKVVLDFADRGLREVIIAYDEPNGLIGYASTKPAAMSAKSEVAIALRPVCRVKVNVACDELKRSGLSDDFEGYAFSQTGQRLAWNDDKAGRLEFLLPAGDYKLFLFGTKFLGDKHAALAVPKDRSEYTAPDMTLPPNALLAIIGKPAPELVEVLGWKGGGVKLADLKGKVVLLEFWGYWCAPCVAGMPVLFELHEKFADKGLAIVGVHVDIDGEVDTPAKLDAKLKGFKETVWKGKDFPFPVAIAAGMRDSGTERGKMPARYGVRSYPTTILIGRDGKVVGHFHARDAKAALAQMEKLLKDDKK